MTPSGEGRGRRRRQTRASIRNTTELVAPDADRGSAFWRAADGLGREDTLLLDTHVWLWILDGMVDDIAAEAVSLVESAAAARRLFVSDISFWEVSLKAAKGRLKLSIDPTLWLTRAAGAPGIQGLPLTRGVLIQSTLLSGEQHSDPADRMLLAQALLAGMSLVTCDSEIIEYAAREPGLPVCDARP